jgi:iron complex transport system ATP-binding protein
MMLRVEGLTGGYDYKTAVVHQLSFTVEKGSFFALLGPNGSGKTTMIRLLMGTLPVHKGKITLDGRPIQDYSSKELARKTAVMTQENEVGLDFSVEEIVMLGRYPYQRSLFFKDASQEDLVVVEEAMKKTSVLHFRNKPFRLLSGGEKQRVLLAKALAQEPELLFLDEPTNHLDVRHTIELLDLLKELQKTTHLTIVAILHDLNLASLYADQLGLLQNGKLERVYSRLNVDDGLEFSKVYGVNLNFHPHPEVAKTQISLSPTFLQEADSTFSSNIVIEEQKNQLHVLMKQPFRTISAGINGKGLGWSEEWIFSGNEDRSHANSEGALVFPSHKENHPSLLCSFHEGNIPIENGKDCCSYAVILSKTPNQKEYHIGLLTDALLTDADLITLLTMVAGVKAKWHFDQSDQSLIAIGALRNKNAEAEQIKCLSEIEKEQIFSYLVRKIEQALKRERDESAVLR